MLGRRVGGALDELDAFLVVGQAPSQTRHHRRPDQLQVRGGSGAEDVGAEHLDPVPSGVVHQRLRRVEPHRLGPQQGRQERRRIVQPAPRTRVDQFGEGERVTLGEAEVGEGEDLGIDRIGLVADQAT